MGTMFKADTLEGHEDYFYDNKVVLTTNIVQAERQCTDPKTHRHDNQYFQSDKNVTLCGMDLAEAQSQGMDKGSTVSALPNDDVILGWAAELLQIKSNPQLVV